uniref:Dynein heavy chain n=1 Tax=Panagrolaimus sp. ES5 TaxID=591445 RepID=A0AC34FBX4_9BILA
MESSLMLLNKAEVTVLCDHNIPLAVEELSQLYSRMHDLSQVIAFDSNDHELLISIVALRRSLPRQITDHRMFFQRRLHIFTNFVKGRQKAVQEHILKSTDKLRMINTFTNPAEVDFYLTEMTTLKPLICTLMEELRELNQFEQVVNFPITRITLIEILESHTEAFVSLFTWAKEFRDREEEFYIRNRINANVEEFRTFVDKFIEAVSELNNQLEGQKSGKHFIIQLWSEVEKLRHCFPIVDVLSCNRLKEWHWSKMSDIVGFDLTQFVDATVAQISELGINHHYARLKPIVYIAEREGIVSDQTNYIINYWQKAVFVVEESTFWNVYLPTNLKTLVKDAAEHIVKLKSFYEPDSSIRQQNARLAVMSDFDMLKLLSDIPEERRLRIIRRVCFPLLTDIYVNHKSQICVVNAEGERVCLGNLAHIGYLRKHGTFSFIAYLAEAINVRIIEEYKKCLERQEMSTTSLKVARMLSDNIQHGIQDSAFKYILKESVLRLHLKGTDKEIHLNLDFIPVSQNLEALGISIAHKWADGKVPLLVGGRQECRVIIRRMAQNMCTPVHIINSHNDLHEDVVQRCAKAAQMNSIIFVFEHIDQLSETLLITLFQCIAGIHNNICPRLVLCSTIEVQDEKIASPNIHIEHIMKSFDFLATPQRSMLSPSPSDTMQLSLLVAERRTSVRRRHSTPKPTTLAESLYTVLRHPESTETIGGMDVACIGPFARSIVSEMLSLYKDPATWIYIDTFANEQLVREGESFGLPPVGYLIDCLKSSWIDANEALVHARRESLGDASPKGHRTSIKQNSCHFIIFYGHHHLESYFPYLSSLICTNTGTNTQWPISFLTLPDGSNFTVAPDVQFILCTPSKQKNVVDLLSRYNVETLLMDSEILPSTKETWIREKKNFEEILGKADYLSVVANSIEQIIIPLIEYHQFYKQLNFNCLIQILKEDIKEVLPYVFPANCGEVLRATVCSTSFNYLLIYLKDIVERFDASVAKFAADADKHIIDPGKLPDRVSQYKISEMDYSRWIKWSEEVHVPSAIDKDSSISDIFITYPNSDRILTFAQRQLLTTNKHLLFCGPPICGKSALVQRFIKHVLVVDCFAFIEATSGFLELLVNEKQLIVDGIPQPFEYDFRLLIIMNETEYEKCYEKKIFVENFISIFVHSPTKDELAFIFEGLVAWHFQSQTFSGEYVSLVTSLSAVAMKLFTTASIKINGAMIDDCGTKVETLFPTKTQLIEEDSSDFYLMKKSETVTVGLDFTLEKLIFSELAAQETMEGIAYSLVADKEEFTRNVENLHFEFSKNHEDWQISLAVTDYVAEHCQRIMRVCRQTGEHLALAGRIGSGRYQCLKLSTFGVIGQIQHVFENAENPNEFEKSWKKVMQQCVLLIAKTNQPVNVVFHFDHIVKAIPQQWLGMLKHWLLNPTLDGLITDDNILKHGEQIVDCERTLATPLTTEEEKNMGQKILSECIFSKKEHLLETLQNIFETTMELFTDHHPSFDIRLWFQLCQKTTNIYNKRISVVQGQITMLSDALKTLSRIRQLSTMGGKVSTEELKSELDDTDLILLMQKRHLNEDTKALDELVNTMTEVEKHSNETEVDILQLQAKIDAIMDEPQKAFVVVAEEISEFSNSDFRKLSMTLKPTLAIRYSIEVLRRVIDPTFQSKKSTIETWPHLQGFIKQPNLMDQVKLFNVYSIDQTRLKMLKQYTENREMRIAKLETESRLAAIICKWVLAAIDVAEANLSVNEEQNGVKIAWEKLHEEREKLILLQKEKDKLEKSVAALKHNVDALEQKITKIKRTINYRYRGSKIVVGLISLEPRWAQQIQTLNRLMNNLIGNSIYDAAFQTFLLDASPEHRQSLCVKWGTILLRASLGYEQRYCTPKNLLLNKLRTVDSREPYPLVYDKTNTLLNASACIAEKHITLKIPDSHGWLNQNFINEVQRSSHSDSTLIIQNVNVSPPLEWYSMLIREPEKGMVNLGNRSCRFNISAGIIFITQSSFQQFSSQFVDMVKLLETA